MLNYKPRAGFGDTVCSSTLTFSIPTPPWVTTKSAVPDDTLPALGQVTVNPAADAIANQEFSDSTHDLNGGQFFVNKVEQVPGAIIDMPASRAGEADTPAGVLNTMEQVPDTPTGAPSTIDTSAMVTVANGASVELQGASAQSVTFAGTTGTLKLENAVGFRGQISGLTGSDALDLADVHYGTKTTATFSGNANGGTLTVTDGNHTAQIALLGDYLGSGWTLSSDGNGGTVVVDPSLYPNASNTGVSAGVKLTPYSGHLTITTAGAVVSGLIISNGVQIAASNVTLENCIIEVSPTAPWDVGVNDGLTGVVIQNCEIIGAGTAGPQGSMGIYVQGNSQVTINAINMHDVGQGVDVNDGQVILENSYIHNLNAGAGTHYEDVGYFGDAKSTNFSFLIQHNTLINEHNQTASVFLQNYFGAVNNVTVNNNILVGGDYTVYMDASGDGGPGTGTPVTNVSFTNNHMGTGIYGYTDFIHWTNPVYTGNINDGQTLITAAGFQSPIVSMASATPGSYSTGNTLTLTLYMSEAVTVQGTPTLSLNDGGTATYSGGTGTNALTFSYTVGSGQNTSALAVTAIDGTITDLDGFALYTANLPATFAGLQIGNGSTSAPVVSVSLSNDTGQSSTDKITSNDALTGSADPNAVVKITEGSNTLGTVTANASGVWSFTPRGLADGSHTIVASETNSAGLTGTGSLTFTLDTTRPTVSSLSASSDNGSTNVTAGHLITVALKASEVVNVTGTPSLQLNDGEVATYLAGSGTNNLTFGYTVKAGDSTSDLQVTALNLSGAAITDAAGNPISGTAQGDLHLQINGSTSAPVVTVSLANDTGQSSTDKITSNDALTGSADPNAVVKITAGSNTLGTVTANASGVWSFTPRGLADGSHTIVAGETNSAGLIGTGSLTFTLDTTAPQPSISSFGATISTTALNGTGEPNSTIKEFDGSTVLATTTVNSSGAWTLTTGSLSAGTHNLAVTDTDVAGNTSSAPFTITAIVGVSENNVLGPTGPGNYILTGNGGADTFVFSGTNFGTNVITDFYVRGGHHDVIQFNQTAFANFAAVQSHSAQVGSNVVITLDAADTVTLVGATLSSLKPFDFHFV